jgi:hypothetical protein
MRLAKETLVRFTWDSLIQAIADVIRAASSTGISGMLSRSLRVTTAQGGTRVRCKVSGRIMQCNAAVLSTQCPSGLKIIILYQAVVKLLLFLREGSSSLLDVIQRFLQLAVRTLSPIPGPIDVLNFGSTSASELL